jgi:hypothetical protein
VGPVTQQLLKGNDPHSGRGRICERDMARVRESHGLVSQNYCVVGGCGPFEIMPLSSGRNEKTHKYVRPYQETLPKFFWTKMSLLFSVLKIDENCSCHV